MLPFSSVVLLELLPLLDKQVSNLDLFTVTFGGKVLFVSECRWVVVCDGVGNFVLV